MLALYVGPGVVDVGENRAWSAEDVILQRYCVVDGDVVLNLAATAHHCPRRDEDVLSDGHIAAYLRARTNMREVPYPGVFPDMGALVNYRTRMYEGGHDSGHLAGLKKRGQPGFGQQKALPSEERMPLALVWRHGCASYVGHSADGAAVVLQAEAPSGQDLLVAFLMQIRETTGELNFRAVQSDRSPGPLTHLASPFGHVLDIDGKKPAHPGMFVFQVACCLVRRGQVHDVVLQLSKHVMQHVEKVNADIRGNTA